ncbi:hypothetical protein M513_12281 [Trichuris suis]|uniref:EGF-like domain-containing protein n=1 Tax=Trichuris suis TaxID=68888 RepID=A0A085LPD9_9BILA|nr:hypothetical protein M513_12281 [Trichuris suis]
MDTQPTFKAYPGESCDNGQHCQERSVCSSVTLRCACPMGTKQSGFRCVDAPPHKEVLAAIGDYCDINTDCINGAYCHSGSGRPRLLPYMLNSLTSSVPVVYPGQQGCSNDKQCAAAYHGATCHNSVCTCPPGSMAIAQTCSEGKEAVTFKFNLLYVIMIEAADRRCPSQDVQSTGEIGNVPFVEVIPKYPPVVTGSPPGGLCSDLVNCLGGSLCNSGVCICPEKLMQVIDGRCVVVKPISSNAIVEVHHKLGNQKTFVAAGSPCGNEVICVGGAVCVDGICQCSKGLRQVQNRCIREPVAKVQPIPGPKVILPQPVPQPTDAPYCLNDDMCNGHSICINSKCSCPAGTTLSNDRCVPADLNAYKMSTRPAAVHDTACIRDQECSEGTMCVQEVCQCPPGFRRLFDGSCRRTILDSLCTTDRSCGDQAICINGRCQCPPGSVQHGDVCILLNPGKKTLNILHRLLGSIKQMHSAIRISILILTLYKCQALSFWDFLNTGQAGLPPAQPFGPEAVINYARQGLNLLSFLKNLKMSRTRANENRQQHFEEDTTSDESVDRISGERLRHRYQDAPLYSRLSSITNVAHDLPGFGACLPKGTPLFNSMSPSILQNFLRIVPGVHKMIKKLQPLPKVKPRRLMGKWYWVLSTTSAMSKYCSMSTFHGLKQRANRTGTFAIINSFRDGSQYGLPKLGFGYGLVNGQHVTVYDQSDPCPYEVILVSDNDEDNYYRERNSQYDYVVLSNWARYPVIVLAKDVDQFFANDYEFLKQDLRREGLYNQLTELLQTSSTADWSVCDAKHTLVKEPHLLLPVDAGATNVNDRKSSAKGPPLLLPPTLTGIVPPGGICSNDEDCSGFPFAYCMSNCMCKDYAINAGSTCLEAGSMAEGNCGVDQVYVSEAGICMNVAKPGAPCQYSQQCSGTEVGAFCINMRCRCVYGMRTTDTGRCTFINTNCTRRGMIWIAELGECKPVVAPGARPCTHRQQCTASYQDSVCFMTQCTCPPETPIAVDGTCGISCPAGRTYSGVLNRCVQAIQPGGRCQYSSQCHALNPGMICQRSICRCPKEYVWTGKQCSESCPEGYRENPENGICRPACREGQVEHAGKCLNQVPPDSPCAISAQCTGGSSCVDGLCRCPYGMYNLQGICSRVPPDSICGPMIECGGGSICVNNVCTCPNGHISINHQCQLPDAVPPGSACTDIDHCAGGSFCLYGTCRCPTGTVIMNRRCQIPIESKQRINFKISIPMNNFSVSPGQKCREDVDICTGRSYCVDGICQCPPHMVIERSICIMPAIVAPGSVCDKTRRCGGGSTCQLGECKCPEGMIIIDQRCQLAKTGSTLAPPTYSCRNDEVCTGGSFCLNGICTCPKGQIPINEVCKSEKAYLTGRCDHDKDCKNGFVCIGGRCSCSGMLLPNGECKVSRLVSPGGKCVLGMDVCSGGSSCISNVCACPTGFYPSSGHCRNRKRGGASCYSGVCICPTQMLQIDGQCQPLLVFPLNGSVETMFMQREPVYTTIYHSSSVHVNGSAQQFAKPLWSTCKSDDFCANGTECIDGICQCPDGYIAVNLTCRLKFSVSPGESCSPSELCSDGSQCIRGKFSPGESCSPSELCSDGSQCIRGKCTCPEGYDLVNKRCHSSKQRQPASPGDACSISTICTGGSSCRAGICKCDFGFEVRQGMCVRRADTISLARPGERCVQEATNCTGGSRCVFGTCKCPKGTVAKNKRCEAATTLSDWALPGQPCDADAECRGGSKCIGSLCTCPVNQVVINHECADAHVTVKPGYACDANSICTGGSTCTSGVCRCPLGQSIEGHHCVARMAIAKPGELCNEHTMVCTGGSVCDRGKCACPPGHEITQNVCKSMWSKRAFPSTPGSFCRPDTAVCTGGSYCLNNVCVCSQGYFARFNQCVPKLNPIDVDIAERTTPCTANSQCQGSSTCFKGMCQCPLNSKWNVDKTVCIPTEPALLSYRGTTAESALPGDSCSNGELCSGGSLCNGRRCICPDGMPPSNGICIRGMGVLAEPCPSDVNQIAECHLPDCYCSRSGFEIPGRLPVEDVPQIVMLTFDDPVNEVTIDIYRSLLDGRYKNPNGCPIRSTFFISHEYNNYHQSQWLYWKGHEVAVNSITCFILSHETLSESPMLEWVAEMDGMRTLLSRLSGVNASTVRGIRAPQMAVGGNRQFAMMQRYQFAYDNSMSANPGRDGAAYWPQTLDYQLAWPCEAEPCPDQSFPGIWAVPINQFYGDYINEFHQYRRGAMVSAAMNRKGGAEEAYRLLLSNFNRHYRTNKAPFVLTLNADFLRVLPNDGGVRALEKFLSKILARPDVWVTTIADAIAWIQQPTRLRDLEKFQPWSCHSIHRSEAEPCKVPKTCSYPASNLSTGDHWLSTCFSCPSEYPWVKKEHRKR